MKGIVPELRGVISVMFKPVVRGNQNQNVEVPRDVINNTPADLSVVGELLRVIPLPAVHHKIAIPIARPQIARLVGVDAPFVRQRLDPAAAPRPSVLDDLRLIVIPSISLWGVIGLVDRAHHVPDHMFLVRRVWAQGIPSRHFPGAVEVM